MSVIEWVLPHVLSILGFLLAIVFIVHILRQKCSPASTVAWLLIVLMLPYVGVPLYILLAGRKVRRKIARKGQLPCQTAAPVRADETETARRIAGDNIFPVREGNGVTLLTTGEGTYAKLMAAIEAAEDNVYITTYIFGEDTTGAAILEALTRKAQQGVRVRLLMDALGSMNVGGPLLDRFKEAGGSYAFFMPMIHLPFRGRANLRSHRKMVLVDGRTGMLGGMNLAREYMGPRAEPGRWRDLFLAVDGPIVADLYTIFRFDWAFAAHEELPEPPSPVAQSDRPVQLQLMPSGPDVEGDPLHDSILSAFFAAQRRVWVITPYFAPDDMLTRALCIVARRGVDVRVVMPLRSNHRLADLVRRSFLRELQDAGAKIMFFRPTMLHGKLILVDDAVAISGSMNVDMRSLFLNFEIALYIASERVAGELDGWADAIMADCDTGLPGAAAAAVFLERVARLFAPLL